MADTASILSQRFLETEGELGRNFTKVMGRFTDLHLAMARPVAASADAVAAAASTAAAPAAHTAEDILQALMRELAAYEYGMDHCKLIQENAMVEMKTYEQMEVDIAAQIASTQSALVGLQSDLDAAKQRRRELEEYEVLTKHLLDLPSRSESASEIARLQSVEQTLVSEHAALAADLLVKQHKYRDVLASMELMASEWTTDEAALARAAEAEEALDRARALEEAALNEAALEAKLAAQAEEEEPEPEQEQEAEREECDTHNQREDGTEEGEECDDKKGAETPASSTESATNTPAAHNADDSSSAAPIMQLPSDDTDSQSHAGAPLSNTTAAPVTPSDFPMETEQ